ncbi:MAG: hypothetical protein HYY02_03755 [Chloroflexi bacterium]|nr:hypothetical protein [Chloroflexota bacterium]
MTSPFTLPRLWAAAALACIFVAVSFTWVYPADFWWHLRLGEEVLSGRGIPTTDAYSFTAQGQPFLYQAWLSGTLLALTHKVGSIPLIVLLNALSFTAAYALLLTVCAWLSEGSLRTAAAAAFGGFLLGVENWAVRPQTFSVLLFALTWWLLWRHALGKGHARSLLLLPFVTALWANLHGAFWLSLILQGCFVLAGAILAKVPGLPLRSPSGPALRPLLLALLASALATLATPYGLSILGYTRTILTDPSIRAFILEWGAPTLAAGPGRALYATLAILLLLWGFGRRALPMPALLALLALGWAALGSSRNVLWFGFVAAPVAATLASPALARMTGWLSPRWQDSQRRHESPSPVAPWLPLLVAAFLLALVVLALPWLRPLLPLPEERRSLLAPDTPVAAVETLAASGAPGRTFADMQYASYLLWRLPGLALVFTDPRIELYAYNLWVDYGTISLGLRPELLNDYGVEALLLSRERQGELLRWVAQHPGWRLVYEDRRTSAWTRLR